MEYHTFGDVNDEQESSHERPLDDEADDFGGRRREQDAGVAGDTAVVKVTAHEGCHEEQRARSIMGDSWTTCFEQQQHEQKHEQEMNEELIAGDTSDSSCRRYDSRRIKAARGGGSVSASRFLLFMLATTLFFASTVQAEDLLQGTCDSTCDCCELTEEAEGLPIVVT
jgi:hypothetical protein